MADKKEFKEGIESYRKLKNLLKKREKVSKKILAEYIIRKEMEKIPDKQGNLWSKEEC